MPETKGLLVTIYFYYCTIGYKKNVTNKGVTILHFSFSPWLQNRCKSLTPCFIGVHTVFTASVTLLHFFLGFLEYLEILF